MTHVILMYHRVCVRSAQTLPWFERGMAVEPEVWRAQIRWMRERFEMVTVSELLDRLSHDQPPCCAVTLDDGWRDVLELELARYDVPMTLYPVVQTTRDPRARLPADALYDLLLRARVRRVRADRLAAIGLDPGEGPVPTIDEGWSW